MLVRFISRYIFKEFVSDIAGFCIGTDIFNFNYRAHILEQKVHSRRSASVARNKLFRSHVVEIEPQQGMERILDIVFVRDGKRGARARALAERACKKMESVANGHYAIPRCFCCRTRVTRIFKGRF